MKAITLTQPWATLVAIGAKRVETRSWGTSYRGPLAIHAAKSFPRWALELVHDPEDGRPFRAALRAAGVRTLDDLPRGAVVATCRLVSCTSTRPFRTYFDGQPMIVPAVFEPAPEEEAFGDFGPGRVAWLLSEITPLALPVPARGALGLWDWTVPETDERNPDDGNRDDRGQLLLPA